MSTGAIGDEPRRDLAADLADSSKIALYRDEALAGKAFLDALRKVDDLDWTMLSPSALFTAGQRTCVFRLGGNSLLTAADGKSWISFEDFAVAMLNEVEHPQHIRQRFTVGY